MNWKPRNAWQHSVLAHTKIDKAGRKEGVVALIDVLINTLLQSF